MRTLEPQTNQNPPSLRDGHSQTAYRVEPNARVREREDGSEGFGAGVKTAFSVSLFWAIVHEIVAEWKH